MKSKLNQNIGISVSSQHCSCQHSTKIKKIKFLNRKIEIQNEIMENQIENYIKVK